MTRQRYDVIVVGARVAGAATAMLLARRGFDVLVVDRSSYGSDTLSTHALLKPAIALLERWNLLDDVAAAGTPPVRSTIIQYKGAQPLHFDLSERPLYAPRRTVIDPILADARKRAGADVRFNNRLLGLEHTDSGRVNGVRLDTPDGPETVACDLVIGADGVNSLVARTVNANTTHQSRHPAGSVMAYFRGIDVDGYRWYYSRASSAGLIPTNDGLTCVFVNVSSQRFAESVRGNVEKAFFSMLVEAAPEFAELRSAGERLSRFRVFPGRLGFTRSASGPGWALVGDAGAFTDPMSAHGMTAALRDATLCATAAGLALEDPLIAAEVWREYETSRDEVTVPFINAIDDVTAYRHDRDRVQLAHIAMSKLTTLELVDLEERERLSVPDQARASA